MNSDKELLEFAAKPASLEYYGEDSDGVHQWFDTDRCRYTRWDPITDDGDALRLAVKLRMEINAWGAGACAVAKVNFHTMIAEPHYGDDPERATRRAIVRAAAEIGKNMK